MISVREAEALIMNTVTLTGTERVPLVEATGRTLRADLRADRPLPPYDRVTMDGIAIRHGEWAAGTRVFRVHAVQRAGSPAGELPEGAFCVEVSTGSVRPIGADCVIPVERISVHDGAAHVDDDLELAPGDSIHPRGSDREQGELLVHEGEVLGAPEIGIAASAGYAELDVATRPRVHVISTGDELVPVASTPELHQVRRSNPHALVAALTTAGALAEQEHAPDERDALQAAVAGALGLADVLLLTGGVSMGAADFVPEILSAMGVERRFHGVRQRPGKPLWFGVSDSGTLVFGLPGNPVSALVTLHRYVLPAIRKSISGRTIPGGGAVLTSDVVPNVPLTVFLPVRVNSTRNGQLRAAPMQTNTSGDFSALGGTDGFIEVVEGRGAITEGEACRLWLWSGRAIVAS